MRYKEWGTKYGRFTTLSIPKYEHFKYKNNKTKSILVCPMWYLVISAVFGLLCKVVLKQVEQ